MLSLYGIKEVAVHNDMLDSSRNDTFLNWWNLAFQRYAPNRGVNWAGLHLQPARLAEFRDRPVADENSRSNVAYLTIPNWKGYIPGNA